MRFSVLVSRIRRSGFSSILIPFPASRASKRPTRKHVKIDDEERLSPEHTYASFHHAAKSTPVQMLKMLLIVLLALLVVMFILAYMIYKPPQIVIDYLQRRYPDVLFQIDIPPSQQVVALTIDDAPSAETGKILDLLKIHNAKVTFFVIGNQITGHTELLERMHQEGHEIGNHAWADEPSLNLPLTELGRQIKEVESQIPRNANANKYFRPGSGFFNAGLVEMVRELGYRVVLGGIYPHDPQIHNPKLNAKHVLSMVRPGGIIIMHDRRSYSADQIRLVLEGLTKNGWKITSVGGLLEVADGLKTKTTMSKR